MRQNVTFLLWSKVKGRRLIINSSGFGLIETIVAIGLFVTFATTAVSTILHSWSINRLSNEQTQATQYAQQGIEVARSIRNLDWSTLVTGDHGLDNASGSWTFSGASDDLGKFTRQTTISSVNRDSTGNIVTTGGDLDDQTLKATCTVAWDFSPTRSNQVELTAYLSNWASSSTYPTPSTCSEYCGVQGYSAGTCRQNTQQCNNNSETYESAGDTFCTGGVNADTCCCEGNPGSGSPDTCVDYCIIQGYSAGTCRQNTQQCNNNSETYESAGDTFCTGGVNADTCCCD